MTLIDRINPEVLKKLKDMSYIHPFIYKDIIDQLKTKASWCRLEYIVAKDIELYGEVDWIGDAFCTHEENKSNSSDIHEQTI
jgi:hypothetical protein